MSFIALRGGLVLLLGEKRVKRSVLPLVALSSGSQIGGALFHLLPAIFSTSAPLIRFPISGRATAAAPPFRTSPGGRPVS